MGVFRLSRYPDRRLIPDAMSCTLMHDGVFWPHLQDEILGVIGQLVCSTVFPYTSMAAWTRRGRGGPLLQRNQQRRVATLTPTESPRAGVPPHIPLATCTSLTLPPRCI